MSAETTTDGNERFVVVARDKYGTENLVVTPATDRGSAKSTIENDYRAFEVGITTIPHDGETTETVISQSEKAAEKIAVGRRGEYSDVPRFIDELELEIDAIVAKPLSDVDKLEADRAADEYQIEQYVETENEA